MTRTSARQETPGPVMRALQRLMLKMTPVHVRLYRTLGGRFVNRATGGAPVLVLTTVGRRTGRSRAVTIGHLRDERDDDDVIVAGTNGGLPTLPAWVLNLRSHPQAEVQLGEERYAVRAEFLEGEERERHWKRLVAAYPAYDQAQQWAGREVPLIRLRRVDDSAAQPLSIRSPPRTATL